MVRRAGAAALLVAALCGLGAARGSGQSGKPGEPGEPFVWDLPPGFPAPAVPADNPMSAVKVELGRRLFYDPRLSGDGTLACAGCHQQDRAFTDGRARARGATGEFHPRSAMSLANTGYNTTLTWADPNLDRLEDQARIPLFNRRPVEMGASGNEGRILARLRQDPDYPLLFRLSFPEEGDEAIRFDTITRALATFQRTLISGRSPYDRMLYQDDREALSPRAKQGMRLFFSETLACSQCHGGFTFSGPIAFRLQGETVAVEPAFHNTGLYNLGDGAYPENDPGLYHHTARPEDMGRFRAPTLRNVAVTAPYMHDGSIATLAEVIDHYAAGGRSAREGHPNPYRSPRIHGFAITEAEKAALIEFLNSLTDENFLTDPRFSDPWQEHGAAAAAGGGNPPLLPPSR